MADQSAAPVASKPPKGRSPSYPGISLPTAIDRARTVYDHAKAHPVPLGTVTGWWGYTKPTTGPASVTYAALKKYGLIDDEGAGTSRVAHLSPLAVQILHPNPGQADAIQEAALTPGIMREWWERFGVDLPPMETLQWEFVVQGPFTENGLSDFVRVYRETIAFAKLDADGTFDREDIDFGGETGDEDDGELDLLARHKRRKPTKAGMRSYAIPVDADHDAVIELPTPMTTERWENFKSFLTAMERVIVDDSPQDEG